MIFWTGLGLLKKAITSSWGSFAQSFGRVWTSSSSARLASGASEAERLETATGLMVRRSRPVAPWMRVSNLPRSAGCESSAPWRSSRTVRWRIEDGKGDRSARDEEGFRS